MTMPSRAPAMAVPVSRWFANCRAAARARPDADTAETPAKATDRARAETIAPERSLPDAALALLDRLNVKLGYAQRAAE